MRLNITQSYYRRSNKKRSPAKFTAKQPNGIGTDVYAVIKLDPILKKHPDLRKGIVKHEREEIKHWAKGQSGCSHAHAKSKEPHVTRRIKGVEHFWQVVNKRKKTLNKK